MSRKNLLLIFTRNPVRGKVKKRLAATVGDDAALEIYHILLRHTAAISAPVKADKWVCYSENIQTEDLWDEKIFKKRLQQGQGLGARMEQAFRAGFNEGYEQIIIIGSDLFDLNTSNLNDAFSALEISDYVIGPAVDGGYYLLGMKTMKEQIFRNKPWSTADVLQETLKEINSNQLTILEERNDIDHYEDLPDLPVFQQFLK